MSTLGSQQVNFQPGSQPVLSPIDGRGQPILDILPNFAMSDLALMIFIMPIAIGWWANWYPGAEPGGGSYIAQRMLASKSEKDSLGGTLFFNLAHYVLRPWPWIITALCSIIIFPELKDIQAAFPAADPRLIGHDSAFPAMLKFLPVGFVGLMVGGLIAANSSTILTHLNWGSSYLVHDFYRRFINADADEKHYVNVGRVCTVVLYIVAALLSLVLNSAQDAFEVLISIGAGTGLLYLLRWFWWRINAWCEVVAMVSSFTISVVFFTMKKTGHALPFAQTVLYSVAIHDGLLAGHRIRQRAHQPRTADCILQKGSSGRAGLDEDSRRSRRERSRGGASRRPHGQGDAGLDFRLPDDLVVALRDRQLSVWPHANRRAPDGRVRRERFGLALRGQPALGQERRGDKVERRGLR